MQRAAARRTALIIPCLVVLATGLAHAQGAHAESAGCSLTPTTRGGEWRSYGHDSHNTRSQPDEHALGPSSASFLAPSWSFTTGRASGGSDLNLSEINGTPVVAGSCVYVGTGFARGQGVTSGDNVFALDAASGGVVWSRYVEADLHGVGGGMGAVMGTPAVSGDLLLVPVNQAGDGRSKGPHIVAFDRRDGRVVWTSRPIVTAPDYYTNSSIALAPHDVAILGFSSPEADENGHGGIGFVDVRTGQLLGTPTYTIPRQDWYEKDGKTPRYGGGGVWSTPAVDQTTGYAYYGTGNPFSKKRSHPRTNAILKVDVDRTRATFGRVVASYSGNIDQYVGGIGNTLQTATQSTTCQLAPDNPATDVPHVDQRQALLQSDLSNSPACGQLDLDFGSSANLFTDSAGNEVVGELQKSGVYHAVPASMTADYTTGPDATVTASATRALWQSELGHSCQFCNASSPAYDAATGQVFVAVAPGSALMAVQATQSAASRTPAWLAPLADITHYEPVSFADGVVYTTDNWGFLDGYDARDGSPVVHRSIANDVASLTAQRDISGDEAGLSGGGVSIAEHTVFVAAGSHVLAYRVPG